MRKKLKAAFIIATVMLALLFAACPVELDSLAVDRNMTPWGNATFSQTLTGNSLGWMRRPMTVEVTFTNGFITNVNITHSETSDHGGILIDRAIPIIERANHFEIDIITGATVTATRNALLAAWAQIRAQLPGAPPPGGGTGTGLVWPPLPITPAASGTAMAAIGGWSYDYVNTFLSYYPEGVSTPIEVTITMTNGFITAATIYGPSESGEIFDPLQYWAERAIVTFNSFELENIIPDWTSGATASYSGIRRGGEAAVQMIIDAWQEGGN